MNKLYKQRLLRAVSRGGHANELMGWFWLVNGLFWACLYFVFSAPHSDNPIIGIGSVFAGFASSTFIVSVVLSIVLGLVHLGIGIYVQFLHGPKTKLLLLLGGSAAALFFWSIIPLIPALFSLYGYYARRKVEHATKISATKDFRVAMLKKRAIVAAILILLAGGLSITAAVRLHQFNSRHGTTAGQSDAQTTVTETDDTYNSSRVVGHCAVTPVASVGCRYTSKTDGFTATFPADTTFAGTPSIHYTSKHLYSNKTAAAKVISSFPGYDVSLLYFADSVTNPEEIQQRLQASAGDESINVSCPYSPSSDIIQATATPTTYNNSPALNYNTAGIDPYQKQPCHYYSLAFMKGSTVYVVSAIAIGSDKDVPSQDSFNKFVASFQLTN